MEQRDRATIDRVCEKILPDINMSTLWPRLIEYGVYNEDDVNVPVWRENLTRLETVRDILLTTKTRGPNAFFNLSRALRRTNQNRIADILEGIITPSPKNDTPNCATLNRDEKVDNALMDDDFHEKFLQSTKPLEIKVKKSTKFLDCPDSKPLKTYRMRSRPRGYVLIITIMKYLVAKSRNAAQNDEANLKKLFEDMGFEVTTKNNLTGAEIKIVVEEFSRRDYSNVDSCFVIISAHGNEIGQNGCTETEIQGIDYDVTGAVQVLRSDIINYFAAGRCNEHLNKKPKVLIFQSCRGNSKQISVSRKEADGSDNDGSCKYDDILVAHSTLPGHVAYLDTELGSWYIQILCSVFMNHACTMHLQDLFNLVDDRVKALRTEEVGTQTSTTKSMGFSHHCYLNPGLFEDP